MPSPLVDLDLEVVTQTDAAILVYNLKEEKVWLPKSAVEDNGDGTFTMPERLAEDKGLI